MKKKKSKKNSNKYREPTVKRNHKPGSREYMFKKKK